MEGYGGLFKCHLHLSYERHHTAHWHWPCTVLMMPRSGQTVSARLMAAHSLKHRPLSSPHLLLPPPPPVQVLAWLGKVAINAAAVPATLPTQSAASSSGAASDAPCAPPEPGAGAGGLRPAAPAAVGVAAAAPPGDGGAAEPDAAEGRLAKALYPNLAMVNHSCDPNLQLR